MSTALMLVGIVVVGVLAVVVGRRRMPSSGSLQLVDRLMLDNRRAVYVVKVGKRALVLGAAEGGVNQLAELDQAEIEELGNASASWLSTLQARRLDVRSLRRDTPDAEPAGEEQLEELVR